MASFDTRIPRAATVVKTSPLMVTIDSFSDKQTWGPCVLTCSHWLSNTPGLPCVIQVPAVGDQVAVILVDDPKSNPRELTPWILQKAAGVGP